MSYHLRFICILVFVVLLLTSCKSEKKPEPVTEKKQGDLELLLSYMIGSFGNQEQAAVDSTFFDIRLEAVHIWKDRIDGHWIYAEQASAQSLDKPYRQRVFRLMQDEDGSFLIDIFVIRDPLRYAGSWQDDNLLSTLMYDSLGQRVGCSIVLIKEISGIFIGGTMGKTCQSARAGAQYATTDFKIGPDEIYRWDRGFDKNDKQVWGARIGGYIMKRIHTLDE